MSEQDEDLERTLSRLEREQSGEAAIAALRRFTKYMRRQITDDDAERKVYSDWVDGVVPHETPLPSRETSESDRGGLEVATQILAEEKP